VEQDILPHRRHLELFRQRFQERGLVDEAEPEQLGPEPAAAPVTGLEGRVELADGDGATLDEKLPKPANHVLIVCPARPNCPRSGRAGEPVRRAGS